MAPQFLRNDDVFVVHASSGERWSPRSWQAFGSLLGGVCPAKTPMATDSPKDVLGSGETEPTRWQTHGAVEFKVGKMASLTRRNCVRSSGKDAFMLALLDRQGGILIREAILS